VSDTATGDYVPEPEPEECETCHGSGRVDRGIGRGHYTDSCDDCGGSGEVKP
jgi:DnaJ-class molecular chaperone